MQINCGVAPARAWWRAAGWVTRRAGALRAGPWAFRGINPGSTLMFSGEDLGGIAMSIGQKLLRVATERGQLLTRVRAGQVPIDCVRLSWRDQRQFKAAEPRCRFTGPGSHRLALIRAP